MIVLSDKETMKNHFFPKQLVEKVIGIDISDFCDSEEDWIIKKENKDNLYFYSDPLKYSDFLLVACFDKMIEKVTVPEDSALRISTNGSNWHFVMFIAPTLTKKYTKDCFFISKRYNSEENLKEIVEIIKAFYNAENY